MLVNKQVFSLSFGSNTHTHTHSTHTHTPNCVELISRGQRNFLPPSVFLLSAAVVDISGISSFAGLNCGRISIRGVKELSVKALARKQPS